MYIAICNYSYIAIQKEYYLLKMTFILHAVPDDQSSTSNACSIPAHTVKSNAGAGGATRGDTCTITQLDNTRTVSQYIYSSVKPSIFQDFIYIETPAASKRNVASNPSASNAPTCTCWYYE